MVDILYTSEKVCPLCNQEFTVTKMRNRLTMLRQDSDFCTYYKEANPYYYVVWVCPHCGYAAQDTYFTDITEAGMVKIKNFLSGRKVSVNFSGERTREQAVATYKLALFYAGLANLQPSRKASLFLKLAWLFREGQQQALEQWALSQAAGLFEQTLRVERLPIGNMSELTVEYLVGELLRRTGKTEEALTCFSKIIGNPRAKLEKRIYTLAREAWQQARAARRQADTDRYGCK